MLLSRSVAGIRNGSIEPGVIDTVRVEYCGQQLPIGHLAQTGRLNSGTLFIDPYDPAIVGTVVRALTELGFSAYQFSKTRAVVSTPPICGEEREKVKKHLRKLGEETKIAIRNLRKHYRQHNPDDDHNAVQALTDKFVTEVERIVAAKIAQVS